MPKSIDLRKCVALFIWSVVVGAAIYIALYGPPWVYVFAGITAAIALFWLRKRHRILYGGTEVLAGIFTLVQSYHLGRGAFTSAFAEAFQPFQWQVVFLATLAGVYIIVRGLDNIEQGWRAHRF
jgi:hypothetical protein